MNDAGDDGRGSECGVRGGDSRAEGAAATAVTTGGRGAGGVGRGAEEEEEQEQEKLSSLPFGQSVQVLNF